MRGKRLPDSSFDDAVYLAFPNDHDLLAEGQIRCKAAFCRYKSKVFIAGKLEVSE